MNQLRGHINMGIQFVKTKTTISPKEYVLGTTVEIETVLRDELASADTITILIQDEWDRVKVNHEAMTEVTPSVYSYLWQSTQGGVTDEPGVYTAFISVTVNERTYVDMTTFEMRNLMEIYGN